MSGAFQAASMMTEIRGSDALTTSHVILSLGPLHQTTILEPTIVAWQHF